MVGAVAMARRVVVTIAVVMVIVTVAVTVAVMVMVIETVVETAGRVRVVTVTEIVDGSGNIL